jgi:hypothetical protein
VGTGTLGTPPVPSTGNTGAMPTLLASDLAGSVEHPISNVSSTAAQQFGTEEIRIPCIS